MEPCEDCGATEGVRYFGPDYTPLCPKHYRQSEENVAAAESANLWVGYTAMAADKRHEAEATAWIEQSPDDALD